MPSGGGMCGGASDELTAWVQEHGRAVDDVSAGSATLYLFSA